MDCSLSVCKLWCSLFNWCSCQFACAKSHAPKCIQRSCDASFLKKEEHFTVMFWFRQDLQECCNSKLPQPVLFFFEILTFGSKFLRMIY